MYRRNKIHNIISAERGMELISEGYFALDPHCHSSFSFDVPDVKETSPESVMKAQRLKGLHNILTDHDNIAGYLHLKRKGYKLIPAMELTFKPKIARMIYSQKPIQTLHINVFQLDKNDMHTLLEISKSGDLDELVTYFKQNDIAWMYNHPFYHEKNEKLNWRVIPELAKKYFDVIELNSTYSKSINNINQRIAEKLGKGIIASSDSHTGNPGIGYTIAEGKNFREFWDNVIDGDAYIMRKDMNRRNIVREASLMINYSFKANNNRKARRYTPATGIETFDNIARSVTSGSLRNSFITKKILQMLLQGLKYTAVPYFAWKLHVTKDEERAEKVRHKIHRITDKIRTFKDKIKHKTYDRYKKHDKTKIYTKYSKSSKKYYGIELVKSGKS
jgi:predicted metal-dependent phosphoesterase TrpH